MVDNDGAKHTAVVGAGTMGTGIASVLARAGYYVELVDETPELAAAARERVVQVIRDGVRRGKITAPDASQAEALVSACSNLEDVRAGPALIVEAVPEVVTLKRAVLHEAERLEPELLVTNTSCISIAELAEDLSRKDRFLGMHFFNPVPAMALVEVVVGSATSSEARDRAVEVVEELGKEPIVVNDAPGFIAGRLGCLLGLEAMRMVEEGVASVEDVDRAMELGYRHPMGPLRLTDLVGLDVRAYVARNLSRTYGSRFEPPPLLEKMIAEGRLGKKTGRGFYEW